MNATTRFAMATVVMLSCAMAFVAPGCAGTKTVMNKASFGLFGGSRNSDGAQESSEETKAERKAREKEEKQRHEAEKREQNEREKAEKAAAKEDTSNEKPGLMSRMTFGLVGGKNDVEDQRQAEAKAAAKEQERQEKAARKQQAKEEKARKDQEKAAAEEAKADANEPSASDSGGSTEKRSLMSRMTFGLADGKSDEEKQQKRREKEARKQQEREEKQAAKERRQQEKAAAKQAKADAKSAEETASNTNEQAESPGEKRSLMSRMTFGLVGGKKDEAGADNDSSADQTGPDATSSKADEKPRQEAEKKAETSEPEQSKPAAEEPGEDAGAVAAREPQKKRTLMSRMTFGLIGGENTAEEEPAPSGGAVMDAADTEAPAQPALPPEQLAMAAPADASYDVQPASAMDAEARKLAKMPFSTAVDLSTKAASGKGQATASRHTYSRGGYGITDIGDVRIAVQGMTFDGESRAGGVIISSDDRAPAGGKSGKDNSAFIYEYAKGVTAVQFGTINFTISKSVIGIGGKSVPIGLGKKLIVADQQGNVMGAYSAE